jgi:dTDP-4-dehydrorhamnose reductase
MLFLDLRTSDKLDIAKFDNIETAFFFAGVTGSKNCCATADSWWVNVEQSYELIKRLTDNGTFLVYLSTNQVFSENGVFKEHDLSCCPLNEYGRQKSQIEHLIMRAPENIAILRVDKVLDRSRDPIKSWFADIAESRSTTAPDNLYFRPVSVDYLVNTICLLGALKKCGVFHLRGERLLSYFEFSRMLFERLSIGKAKVSPFKIQLGDFNPKEAYPELCMAHTGRIMGISAERVESVINYLVNEEKNV